MKVGIQLNVTFLIRFYFSKKYQKYRAFLCVSSDFQRKKIHQYFNLNKQCAHNEHFTLIHTKMWLSENFKSNTDQIGIRKKKISRTPLNFLTSSNCVYGIYRFKNYLLAWTIWNTDMEIGLKKRIAFTWQYDFRYIRNRRQILRIDALCYSLHIF